MGLAELFICRSPGALQQTETAFLASGTVGCAIVSVSSSLSKSGPVQVSTPVIPVKQNGAP